MPPLHNVSAYESSTRVLLAANQPFWWSAGVAIITGCVAWAGAGESLWLDELHSSWTIAGSGEEIAGRAAAGNQSPLYFWLLLGVTATLGQSEWSLRLISAVSSMLAAFVVCLLLAGWNLSTRRPELRSIARGDMPLIASLVLAWIALDRIQLFYATEARVYALLQLFSLLGWCVICRNCLVRGAAVDVAEGPLPTKARELAVWCGLSILAIYLHLVAVLFVAWQAGLAIGTSLWRRDWPSSQRWFLALCLVSLGSIPTLTLAPDVWQRRDQWESFAGDASWQALLAVFPVLPLLVPVLVAGWLDWCLNRNRKATESEPQKLMFQARWLWAMAASGPLLTVWMLTAFDIAPMLHRRYVLCSALPIVILAGLLLLSVRRSSLQVAALVAASTWLYAGQGTLNVWMHQQWIGEQRGEDWKAASAWCTRQIEPEDEVWCASGLIEGKSASIPPAERMNDYLSFPLRGMYRMDADDKRTIEPQALFGNATAWRKLLDAGGGAGEGVLFVFYRGTKISFEKRLDRLLENQSGSGQSLRILDGPREFGRVVVAKLRRY